MKIKQYRILSRSSSHRNEIGNFVSGFQYGDEVYYTLKLKNEGFRSYPARNLELVDDEAIVLVKSIIKSLQKIIYGY